MALTQRPDRRDILYFLGGGALLAAGLGHARAAETRIGHLISEAQSKGSISEKIDFISGALRGTRLVRSGEPWAVPLLRAAAGRRSVPGTSPLSVDHV